MSIGERRILQAYSFLERLPRSIDEADGTSSFCAATSKGLQASCVEEIERTQVASAAGN
jgi:hypothetical protein